MKTWVECESKETPVPWFPSVCLLIFAVLVLLLCINLTTPMIRLSALTLYNSTFMRSTTFEPGETIYAVLSTTAKRIGDHTVTWWLSTDNGLSWQDMFLASSSARAEGNAKPHGFNGISFEISAWAPLSMIQARYKRSIETQAFASVPRLRLLSGPGSSPTEDMIYTAEPVEIGLAYDDSLIGSSTTWRLYVADAIHGVFQIQPLEEFKVQGKTLTWTPDAMFATFHIRYRLEAVVGNLSTSVTSWEMLDTSTTPVPVSKFTIDDWTITPDGVVTVGDTVQLNATFHGSIWPPMTTIQLRYHTNQTVTPITNIRSLQETRSLKVFEWIIPTLTQTANDFRVEILYNNGESSLLTLPITVRVRDDPKIVLAGLRIAQLNVLNKVFRAGTTIQLQLLWSSKGIITELPYLEWSESRNDKLTWQRITDPTMIGPFVPNVYFQFTLPSEPCAAYNLRVVHHPSSVDLGDNIQLDHSTFAVTQLGWTVNKASPGTELDVRVLFVGKWNPSQLQWTYTENNGPATPIVVRIPDSETRALVTAPTLSAPYQFVLTCNGISSPPLEIKPGLLLLQLFMRNAGSLENGVLTVDCVVDYSGVPSLPAGGIWEYQPQSHPNDWFPAESVGPIYGDPDGYFTWRQTVYSGYDSLKLRLTIGTESIIGQAITIGLATDLSWDTPQLASDQISILPNTLSSLLDQSPRLHKTKVTFSHFDASYQVTATIVSSQGLAIHVPANQMAWVITGATGGTLYWWITSNDIATAGSYWFEIHAVMGSTLVIGRSVEMVTLIADTPPILYSTLGLKNTTLTLQDSGSLRAEPGTEVSFCPAEVIQGHLVGFIRNRTDGLVLTYQVDAIPAPTFGFDNLTSAQVGQRFTMDKDGNLYVVLANGKQQIITTEGPIGRELIVVSTLSTTPFSFSAAETILFY
jgi:hypothetical protein